MLTTDRDIISLIQPRQLVDLLLDDRREADLFIIDARSRQAYATAHVWSAVHLWMTLDEFWRADDSTLARKLVDSVEKFLFRQR